jgi:hypothetical protein
MSLPCFSAGTPINRGMTTFTRVNQELIAIKNKKNSSPMAAAPSHFFTSEDAAQF